jgi:ABC-type microcin C transport system duplicated ATPase subunit YejF
MCVALLERPSSGEIWFNGQPMSSLTKAEYVLLRPKVQIIFQDSAAALPARFTAAQIIEEPLTIQGHHSIDERSRLTLELMAKVGLSPAWSNRLPNQLSGGQRQRLAIARSLVLRPDVLVLDEPFTGLDLSVRNQIVNLLLEIQAELELTYLYISHDLELVRYFSDSVALIHEGEIVENANVTDLFSSPRHAVTRALLGSKGSALRSSRSRLVQ